MVIEDNMMGYGEMETHATLTRRFVGSSPTTPAQS